MVANNFVLDLVFFFKCFINSRKCEVAFPTPGRSTQSENDRAFGQRFGLKLTIRWISEFFKKFLLFYMAYEFEIYPISTQTFVFILCWPLQCTSKSLKNLPLRAASSASSETSSDPWIPAFSLSRLIVWIGLWLLTIFNWRTWKLIKKESSRVV